MSLLIAVFACGLVSGGGATHAAIPQSAAVFATLAATAPPVRLAEEDVDDEGEGDNDNEGSDQRASLVTVPAGKPAGFVQLAQYDDDLDDEGDDTEDDGDDADLV